MTSLSYDFAMVAMLRPRQYVCEQTGCHFRGEVRKVHPTRYGRGMLVWPVPCCECTPDIPMRQVSAQELEAR